VIDELRSCAGEVHHLLGVPDEPLACQCLVVAEASEFPFALGGDIDALEADRQVCLFEGVVHEVEGLHEGVQKQFQFQL
jgi:hypothetical protein